MIYPPQRHNGSWRLEAFRPAHVPLTIVCGAAASGKSRWVSEHAGAGDLVIDVDAIACDLAGIPLTHDWNRRQWFTAAMNRRTNLLAKIMNGPTEYPAAWLIAAEPDADARQWWADKVRPAAIVVMETPLEVCLERITADQDRAAISRDWAADWWRRYERRDGDTVIEWR